jgi:Bacterial Ig-like domain (group 2)
MRGRSRASVVVAALAGLALSACEKVDYIEIAPAEVELKQPNNSQWLQAKCMARNGARAVQAIVKWSVKDPSVAAVTERGLVTPVGSGETEVIATYRDLEARVPVRVIFVERIEVEPKALTLKEGQEAATVTVKAFGKSGKPITDRSVTLVSKNKSVAQIVGGGAILPLDPGEGIIEVQVDGAKASIVVVVEKDATKKKP